MSSHFPPCATPPKRPPSGTTNSPLSAQAINSGLAAMISTIIVYPLDMCKTRLQNQKIGPNGERLYNSMIDCGRKTYKAEGIRGVYRGCFVSAILIAPEKTIKLVVNGAARKYFRGQQPLEIPLPIYKECLAASISGMSQSIISTPMELLKINLQDEGRRAALDKTSINQKTNAREIAAKLWKEKGLRGFYRGYSVTAGRNVLFSAVYFPSFYRINMLGPTKSDGDPTSAWAFISGVISGAISAAFATPFDVVKSRRQRLKLAKSDVEYSGSWDAFVKIFRTEGPLALMKGAGIRAVSIAPLFGILQTIYYLGIGEYLINFHE